MLEQNKETVIQKENLLPVKIKAAHNIIDPEKLLQEKTPCVSFRDDSSAVFSQRGAYIVLDFGREICGGIRIFAGSVENAPAQFRITLGESLSEACSSIGEKNATNDHSPRDFQVLVPSLSDLTFGQSGFRFARVELLTEGRVHIANIYAVSTLPCFEREGYIKTSDEALNRIIETAAYTLKLNLQNGFIWDGIKRDRLVWSGDLHQEILLSAYLYGDIPNISNSLEFLSRQTPADAWINSIPSYSAWWVINLCDYCRITGNRAFFEAQRDYARAVIRNVDRCVSPGGEMDFSAAQHFMPYFLDWPTLDTPDAKIGTAALIVYMAKKYLEVEDDPACHRIITKLSPYLDMDCRYKQTRAFQILAGRDPRGQAEVLEKNGAEGFSTFMAYYILKADAMARGGSMLSILKEYFGAMLSRGATTFWEDFDLRWLEGSGRIDELPEADQKDLHGDHGAFCYAGFRHSLCHGWASGVLAFIIEHMIGVKIGQGGKVTEITPDRMGVEELHACLPVPDGWLQIDITGDRVNTQILP